MKEYPNIDFTFCNNKNCAKRDSCKRYLGLLQIGKNKIPLSFSIDSFKGDNECNMYIKAE